VFIPGISQTPLLATFKIEIAIAEWVKLGRANARTLTAIFI
jgi:hypothetical protein